MIPQDDSSDADEVRLAACALLLEVAHADEHFTPEEREHIEYAVGRNFGLSHVKAEELLSIADRQRCLDGDVESFAQLIAEHYSTGQRMVLAEVMWGLVHSDGWLAPREEQLMTRVNSLLGFMPGYLSSARADWAEDDPQLGNE
jgi:uncharacterized tellurite resistance protein B-like protein